MKQRIFSHFQDYLIQYISRVVHYVFNPDHYIGIVIANTTLLYK
jgi:hypothetical protein